MIDLGEKNATAAGLFMLAVADSFNVVSALNSSPWTAETFGKEPDKAKSAQRYVYHAIIIDLALGAGASLIAQHPAPLIGTVAGSIYIYWIYKRALQRAVDKAPRVTPVGMEADSSRSNWA